MSPADSPTPASPAVSPTMTADQIREALDRESCLWVTRDGERFLISEDESATGFYAWRDDAMAGNVVAFGPCDYPGDVLTTPPDYRALSERIALWLNGGTDAR